MTQTRTKSEATGRCFVIQPFDRGKYDNRYKDVFAPAILAAEFEPYRVDQDPEVVIPINDIEKGITDSEICFAEITTDNPNVWFELGYAIASSKPVCMICSDERITPFPFDVRHRTIVTYKTGSPSDYIALGGEITKKMIALRRREQKIDAIVSLGTSAQAEGLASHEATLLAIVMTNSENGAYINVLLNQMRSAGFTPIATNLGLEQLMRNSLVQKVITDDYEGVSITYQATPAGVEWLMSNQDMLHLRLADPAPYATRGRPDPGK